MIESLPDVLEEWFDSMMDQVHTVLPGKILSYDDEKRIAQVKIEVKLPFQTGELLEVPPIDNVPVWGLVSSQFSLKYDPTGDGCLILFSSVAIGNYLANTGDSLQEPESLRKFALTDAIAIPGLFPGAKLPDSSKTPSIVVENNEIKVNTPDGGSLQLLDGSFSIADSSGNTVESGPSSVKVNGNLEVLQ